LEVVLIFFHHFLFFFLNFKFFNFFLNFLIFFLIFNFFFLIFSNWLKRLAIGQPVLSQKYHFVVGLFEESPGFKKIEVFLPIGLFSPFKFFGESIPPKTY
jgi:hypothetical protein